MPSGQIQIVGSITTATGVLNPTVTINIASPAAIQFYQTLASGDNSFTIPTSPAVTAILIIMPAGNTVVTKFKHSAGDAGETIRPDGAMLFQPASTETVFILNAASAISSFVTIYMW